MPGGVLEVHHQSRHNHENKDYNSRGSSKAFAITPWCLWLPVSNYSLSFVASPSKMFRYMCVASFPGLLIPAFVLLQATNAGVRRPGNKANMCVRVSGRGCNDQDPRLI